MTYDFNDPNLFTKLYYIVPRLQAFLRKPNRDILFATIGQH